MCRVPRSDDVSVQKNRGASNGHIILNRALYKFLCTRHRHVAGYTLFAASNSPPPLARVVVSPLGGAYGESLPAGTRGRASPLAHYRDGRGIVCAQRTVPLHVAIVYDR